MSEPLLAGGGGGAEGDEWRHGKRDDMEEIKSVGQFIREAAAENRRMWALAVPAIFTSVAQYSLGAFTQVFAGHLTTLDLDAVSVENMVIAGLAFGVMRLFFECVRRRIRALGSGDMAHPNLPPKTFGFRTE